MGSLTQHGEWCRELSTVRYSASANHTGSIPGHVKDPLRLIGGANEVDGMVLLPSEVTSSQNTR
jgi:hypothetical protein